MARDRRNASMQCVVMRSVGAAFDSVLDRNGIVYPDRPCLLPIWIEMVRKFNSPNPSIFWRYRSQLRLEPRVAGKIRATTASDHEVSVWDAQTPHGTTILFAPYLWLFDSRS